MCKFTQVSTNDPLLSPSFTELFSNKVLLETFKYSDSFSTHESRTLAGDAWLCYVFYLCVCMPETHTAHSAQFSHRLPLRKTSSGYLTQFAKRLHEFKLDKCSMHELNKQLWFFLITHFSLVVSLQPAPAGLGRPATIMGSVRMETWATEPASVMLVSLLSFLCIYRDAIHY